MSELLKDLENNSLLLASLSGLRSILEKELNVSNIAIASDDMVKNNLANKGDVKYPYAYISLTELAGVKDQVPNKTIRRLGYSLGTFNSTKSTTQKAYMFPVTIAVDFKYVDSDPYRCIRMVEALVILSQIDALYYDIVLNEEYRYHNRVEIPENTSIPLSDTNNPQTPGGMEVSVSMILHTYCGFVRDVAAVQASTPVVNFAFTVDHIKGGIEEAIE